MRKAWLCGVVIAVAGGCGGRSLGGGGEHSGSDPEGVSSLWPLTEGSWWRYRISDGVVAPFEKRVEVVGEGLVKSVQPHLEELSWQVAGEDGTVHRVREEDRKQGLLVRTTTWDPATIKALASAQEAGWQATSTIVERVVAADGTVEEKTKSYTWRVLGEEAVITPKGPFQALKVQRDRTDKETRSRIYWLVPGVGKVREEGERTEELLEFEVK